ncbi:formyltransferase [Geomonas silvestris]|uniref:Formyltransferase n=1 Tax=Geomonas silvestris TaxID=2740184 RepID=A0A6V8ME16_9BACT|nr:formyltransferase [Geomonas silvestris]GFO58228.1 formyltransferase [Geomonas silvestris]
MEKKKTLVVCAYHNVGYRCLEELLRQDADVAMVFTHDDSPSEEIWFASVRELAERHGIPVMTSDINLKENIELLKELAPDLLLSFYYRNMIREEVLETPRLGALNLHGSYLPKYRGRVPVNWAVINGESETGATLHYMVAKPDAGDIVDQEKVAIDFTDTAFDVFNKVTEAAVKVLARSYQPLIEGRARRIPMDLAAGSYFGGRKPADGRIDWQKSAVEIYNLIRGVTHPYPGAFTCLNGKKVLIWSARPTEGQGEPGRIVSSTPLLVGTGSGLLEIERLQEEESGELDATAFAVQTDLTGSSFGSAS